MTVINSVTPDHFPSQIFRDKDGPCEILTAAWALIAANSNPLVTAVSGKRIRVVAGSYGSTAAGAGYLVFTSLAAGVAKWITNNPPNTLAPVILEFNPAGWFETNTGEGLFVDVGTNGSYGTVRYIVYTPS